MLKRWAALPRGIRWLAGIVAAALALAFIWALFVPVADLLAHHDVGSATGLLHETALDNARGRLLTLGAGLLAAGALWFTARNFTLSREGQVTDRYAKAVEQLGSDKPEVRIGGIYALERIARDSARDHPVVMEVLTAFIREHARQECPRPEGLIWPDIQAALTVVGRRDEKRDIGEIDLSEARLSFAKLARAKLAGANLSCVDFTNADLYGAILSRAFMDGADLDQATLFHARLNEADLAEAENPAGAHFDSATDLTGAMWPKNVPVPEGWELDADSGTLRRADTGPSPTEEG